MEEDTMKQFIQDIKEIDQLKSMLKKYFGQNISLQFDHYEDGELELKILLPETEQYASVAFQTIRYLDLAQTVNYIETQLIHIDSTQHFFNIKKSSRL